MNENGTRRQRRRFYKKQAQRSEEVSFASFASFAKSFRCKATSELLRAELKLFGSERKSAKVFSCRRRRPVIYFSL
jgi:hypothetical protein